MRLNFSFARAVRRAARHVFVVRCGMDGFETYLLLLPSGVGGHDRDADRLRVLAELHGYDGWLLGCRDHGRRNGRRRVTVTPLMTVGTPAGTIGAALTAAGVLHGCDYVLAATAERP